MATPKMIAAHDAANLAHLYHDVMNMVSRRSDAHVSVMTTPRKLLNDYVAICNRTGIQLHNEHWLKVADAAVVEIEAKRTAAIAKMRAGWAKRLMLNAQ